MDVIFLRRKISQKSIDLLFLAPSKGHKENDPLLQQPISYYKQLAQLVKLVANTRVARDNYFYGGFIKFFFFLTI